MPLVIAKSPAAVTPTMMIESVPVVPASVIAAVTIAALMPVALLVNVLAVSRQVDAIYIYLILLLIHRYYKPVFPRFYAISTCRICQAVKDAERGSNKHIYFNTL